MTLLDHSNANACNDSWSKPDFHVSCFAETRSDRYNCRYCYWYFITSLVDALFFPNRIHWYALYKAWREIYNIRPTQKYWDRLLFRIQAWWISIHEYHCNPSTKLHTIHTCISFILWIRQIQHRVTLWLNRISHRTKTNQLLIIM